MVDRLTEMRVKKKINEKQKPMVKFDSVLSFSRSLHFVFVLRKRHSQKYKLIAGRYGRIDRLVHICMKQDVNEFAGVCVCVCLSVFFTCD